MSALGFVMAISINIVQLLPRKRIAFHHIKVDLTTTLLSRCQASTCWSKDQRFGGGNRFVLPLANLTKLIDFKTSYCRWLVEAWKLVAVSKEYMPAVKAATELFPAAFGCVS